MQQQLNKIRKIYKKELQKKEELEKLLQSKSVNKYIEMMNYEKPPLPFNEHIMNDILNKFSLPNINNIYINNGLYLSTYDHLCCQKYILIKISDIDNKYIRKQINEGKIKLPYDISTHFYNLESGEELIGGVNTRESTIITLPELKNRLANLCDYDGYNDGNFRTKINNIVSNDNSILRAQFFMLLMNNKLDDVVEFYSQQENWPLIEKQMKTYKEEKNKVKQYK